MKTKKVILKGNDYALLGDNEDENLIYALFKNDLEKLMTLKNTYINEEPPDEITIPCFKLSKISDNGSEEIYNLVDMSVIDIPIKRIELKFFKIEYDNNKDLSSF
jgi:hypothetical protein